MSSRFKYTCRRANRVAIIVSIDVTVAGKPHGTIPMAQTRNPFDKRSIIFSQWCSNPIEIYYQKEANFINQFITVF